MHKVQNCTVCNNVDNTSEGKIQITEKACSVLTKKQTSNLPFQYGHVGKNVCRTTRDTGADSILLSRKLVENSELTGKRIFYRLADGTINSAAEAIVIWILHIFGERVEFYTYNTLLLMC